MMAASFLILMVLTILAPAAAEGAETGAGLPWTIVGLAIAGAAGVVAGLGGYWLWSNRGTDR
jgi:drug/metabolite transporter (DMT)-like permease